MGSSQGGRKWGIWEIGLWLGLGRGKRRNRRIEDGIGQGYRHNKEDWFRLGFKIDNQWMRKMRFLGSFQGFDMMILLRKMVGFPNMPGDSSL